MATQLQLVTAEELLEMPADGVRRELVRGELKEMTPPGHLHGRTAMRIGARLDRHVEENGLGAVYAAETGFRLASEPDTVRAADAAFVRQERVEQIGDAPGYFPGPPDLAIEVVSPGDRFSEVEGKVLEWLDAGTRIVIVMNPAKWTATVYRSRSDIAVLGVDDTLDGADVVPGWAVAVSELFG